MAGSTANAFALMPDGADPVAHSEHVADCWVYDASAADHVPGQPVPGGRYAVTLMTKA